MVLGVPLLDRLKIDDVVGAIPVHLFAGIWGTLAVLITNPDATLFGQLVPIIIVGVAVFGSSCLIWAVLKSTIGIRVDEEVEINGLDHSEMGVEAYPEFTLTRQSGRRADQWPGPALKLRGLLCKAGIIPALLIESGGIEHKRIQERQFRMHARQKCRPVGGCRPQIMT